MSTTTYKNGRFCNQIIRNLAVSLIAEKNDLYVTYSNYMAIRVLGINLFCGTKIYQDKIQLHEHNYFSLYNSEVSTNLNSDAAFFQTKEITNLLYKHLTSGPVRNTIIMSNPFQNRYGTNNDVCIHVRLGDVCDQNPGVRYYLKTISDINFDNLYIATDTPDHDTIKKIMNMFPNAKILDYDEVRTIQFASTCKHIVLSHGSFSAMIGYLGFFSTVNYPEFGFTKMWHGDMFSIDGWVSHPVNKMDK